MFPTISVPPFVVSSWKLPLSKLQQLRTRKQLLKTSHFYLLRNVVRLMKQRKQAPFHQAVSLEYRVLLRRRFSVCLVIVEANTQSLLDTASSYKLLVSVVYLAMCIGSSSQ